MSWRCGLRCWARCPPAPSLLPGGGRDGEVMAGRVPGKEGGKPAMIFFAIYDFQHHSESHTANVLVDLFVGVHYDVMMLVSLICGRYQL